MEVKKWELMEHQKDAVEKIFENYNIGNNTVVYTSGVGTGKTSVFCGVAREIKGKILYIIPKKAIIANVLSNKMFKQENLECRTDFTTFNYFSDETKGVKLDEYELIVIDEAHHIGSNLYGKILIECLRQRNIKALGLTATPERMDDLNVSTLFKATVNGLTNFEAITKGLMPRIEYLVCSPEEEVDMSSVLVDWKNSYKLLREAIQDNPKNKWICFFSEIAELEAMKSYIKLIFPNYEILEVHSNSGNTQQILDKANKTDKCVMLNCDMLLEGLHFDNVDGIILFRNVHSLPVFEQIIGRVSAMFKKENPLVIDCTDTWLRMDRYIEYRSLNDNSFDFGKEHKDGLGGFNDVIGRNSGNSSTTFKTPCYVSLKNKKYYDYMKFLEKKHRSIQTIKNTPFVYKSVEYPSKNYCCKVFNVKQQNVCGIANYHNISFSDALDIAIAKENNVVCFREEEYKNWNAVCKKYNLHIATVCGYKRRHNVSYEDAIEYFINLKNNHSTSRTWTDNEIKILRKYYPKEGSLVYKRLNNKNAEQCRSYARRLNIKMIDTSLRAKPKKWTDKELKIMYTYYPIEGKEVFKRLDGRTIEQCRSCAKRLKIKILKN